MPNYIMRLTLLIGMTLLTACERPHGPIIDPHPPIEERITFGLAGLALGTIFLSVLLIDGFSDGVEGIFSGEP